MNVNAVIYDIEIRRAIPPKTGERLAGIEYCEGWQDHANMGVAVLGAYDCVERRYRVFCDDNLGEWNALVDSGRLCVGFNSIPFDNAVLAATEGWRVPPEDQCYDLLREIWIAAGLPPKFDLSTHGGYGLDAVCAENFGARKSGNGALAPVLWQQGQVGAVIDYCLQDIRLTKLLFDRAMAEHPIINPKSGGASRLMLRQPPTTL